MRSSKTTRKELINRYLSALIYVILPTVGDSLWQGQGLRPIRTLAEGGRGKTREHTTQDSGHPSNVSFEAVAEKHFPGLLVHSLYDILEEREAICQPYILSPAQAVPLIFYMAASGLHTNDG